MTHLQWYANAGPSLLRIHPQDRTLQFSKRYTPRSRQSPPELGEIAGVVRCVLPGPTFERVATSIFGPGIFASDGVQWRHPRTIISRLFRQQDFQYEDRLLESSYCLSELISERRLAVALLVRRDRAFEVVKVKTDQLLRYVARKAADHRYKQLS